MSTTTGINWTDCTYNAWEGCTKVSPGCEHCYAETRNARFGGGTPPNWGRGAPRKIPKPATLNKPVIWNRLAGLGRFRECDVCGGREFRKWDASTPPGGLACCSTKDCLSLPETDSFARRPRVFCSSLADWLDDEVPLAWLYDLLVMIRVTPNLDYQLLTKRPQNFHPRLTAILNLMGNHLTLDESYNKTFITLMRDGWQDVTYTAPQVGRENYWIGTTVEDKPRKTRIDALRQIPAKVRFLSCEPLLEDLGELNLSGIHWIIAGGESGAKARPLHPDWVRNIRDQAQRDRIPFLFKQWGEWGTKAPLKNGAFDFSKGKTLANDGTLYQAGDLTFPNGPRRGEAIRKDHGRCSLTRIYKLGKHHTGRSIDGREWNEFPTLT